MSPRPPAWLVLSSSMAISTSTVAATSQVPPGDREFAVAVESSIHRFGTIRSYDQVLTTKHARLIRRLGCGHYDCRQDAAEHLTDEGEKAFRALLWGAWSADREVAARCRAISRQRWYLCSNCNGNGEGGWAGTPCYGCGGTGDTRNRRED